MVRHARHGRQHRLAGIPGASAGARRAARRTGARTPLSRIARSAPAFRAGGARAAQTARMRRRPVCHRRARPGAGQASRRACHPGIVRAAAVAGAEFRQRARTPRRPVARSHGPPGPARGAGVRHGRAAAGWRSATLCAAGGAAGPPRGDAATPGPGPGAAARATPPGRLRPGRRPAGRRRGAARVQPGRRGRAAGSGRHAARAGPAA
ncbi:Uncharacterised protein [Bordetella pertussis]|nr:Uncharacterised protein [Bordetella pertussis]CPI96156.1 Uncharacterised protein [Bordetella pertussis]CPJ29511.1 Uncharacterised protein [Bordetella pertussis]CPJ80165.1 Uncharacterised protein [Bordetella pertussis]CPK09484.1 Uncharacterised protein [Bordetella pertussis]